MRTVEVKLQNPYNVLVGARLLDSLGKYVKEVLKANKLLIATDDNVGVIYLERAKKALTQVGFEVCEFVFKAGERSKTVNTYLDIIDCLGANGFKRTDAVIALGGGVVGDIAGFAAATYMRGIDVVQVPTSLLAMIDSSVGGKTGVDLSYGKNLLGAFHQPKLVVADTALLDTLAYSEWTNGLGEGIKYACLAGGRIFEILLEGFRMGDLDEFVSLCVEYKADIVSKDEKEGGLRRLLNLGHTVGHAVEKLANYELPHGACVAYGISRMANAAAKHSEIRKEERDIILALLEKYGLKDIGINGEICGDILGAISMDKKADGKDNISFVSINGIGNCKIRQSSLFEFEKYIND